MKQIIVLTNNVILMGEVTHEDGVVTIEKPYSITLSPDGYLLQPFLEKHTGNRWDIFTTSKRNILSIKDADKNDILDEYLKLISGIQTEDKQIILG